LTDRHPTRSTHRHLAAILIACIVALASATAFADRLGGLAHTLVSSRHDKARIAAAINLGKLDDPRAVGPLITALSDRNRVVRAVAAVALGHLGYTGALPALRHTLRDPDRAVRRRAREAIARIETKVGAQKRVARLMRRANLASYRVSAHERPRVPPADPTLFVVLKSTSDRSHGRARRAIRHRRARAMRELMQHELEMTPEVTVDEDEAQRLGLSPTGIDVSIQKLHRRRNGPYIEVECQLRVAISDGRGKMLSFLTGGAKVQVPRRMYARKNLPQMRLEALENAVKGVHQDLINHLSLSRSRLSAAD
jgi:hypothetical protein